MIFKFAVSPAYSSWTALYYNRRGRISRSGTSTRASKSDLSGMANNLPRVCRQVY
jgi:hypothetical protein